MADKSKLKRKYAKGSAALAKLREKTERQNRTARLKAPMKRLKNRSVELALSAVAKGVTPVEVMLDNMRFYHEEAEALLKRIYVRTRESEGMDEEKAFELVKIMKRMLHNRDRANMAAAAAAPYCHARLATMTLKGDVEHPIPIAITKSMTPREAAEVYAATLSGK